MEASRTLNTREHKRLRVRNAVLAQEERLVVELRLAGADTLEAATPVLDASLSRFHAPFAVPATPPRPVETARAAPITKNAARPDLPQHGPGAPRSGPRGRSSLASSVESGRSDNITEHVSTRNP